MPTIDPTYSGRKVAVLPHGLKLESGATLRPVEIAYETWGTLSPEGDNAVLVCHALSGDSHVADTVDDDGTVHHGWWGDTVGPGLAIDTDRYFVICTNVVGGCSGSTGPGSTDLKTGHRYGLDFPLVTIEDMVNAQARLLDLMGIERLLAVVGGSLGGMQALAWTCQYPHRIGACVACATTWRTSAQAIAFNEVGRRAIIYDDRFNEGHYDPADPPAHGLAIARMIGHITYLSDESMAAKFGRRLRNETRLFGFGTDFEVESYLDHQGKKFVDRFDASTYLYLTKAMDYFQLADSTETIMRLYEGSHVRFLLMSFSSDWLFPTYQMRELNDALLTAGVGVSFIELQSGYGHDAFLLEVESQRAYIEPFLERARDEGRGLVHE